MEEDLHRALKGYFASTPSEEISALVSSRRISLRFLDYFVTQYARSHNTVYAITAPDGEVRPFFVYSHYKHNVKAYTKKWFDPFSRGPPVEFAGVKTTLGQMNFLRWALANGVIEYAEKHAKDIERAMRSKTTPSSRKVSGCAHRKPSIARLVVTLRF